MERNPCPSCGANNWVSRSANVLECVNCLLEYEGAEYFALYAQYSKEYRDGGAVEEEAKKTHGPGNGWGPKTERCIKRWHKDEPGTKKSKIIAVCRTMHKNQ